MRVVLDTNILLSACWKPGGLEAKLVNLAIDGHVTACVSAPIAAEYKDVLFRPKFAQLHAQAADLLAKLEPRWVFIEPTARANAATDEDDNRFLECAAAAQAEFLVTGNLKHYPAKYFTTQIVNARAFFELRAKP